MSSNLPTTVTLPNGKEFPIIEYRGKLVTTLPIIDTHHKIKEGTSGRAFRRNKNRYVLNKEYFEVPYEEWSKIKVLNLQDKFTERTSRPDQDSIHGGHKGSMIFLTEYGYLLLCKSLTDDTSWEMQRMIIEGYFKSREIQPTKSIRKVKVRRVKEDQKDIEIEIISQMLELQNKTVNNTKNIVSLLGEMVNQISIQGEAIKDLYSSKTTSKFSEKYKKNYRSKIHSHILYVAPKYKMPPSIIYKELFNKLKQIHGLDAYLMHKNQNLGTDVKTEKSKIQLIEEAGYAEIFYVLALQTFPEYTEEERERHRKEEY